MRVVFVSRLEGMDHDALLRPVDGHPDLMQFVADIGFSGGTKAVTQDDLDKYGDQLKEGDLLIRGIGANFEMDREYEAFAEGAFDRGLKRFLDGEATLAYHHKHDHVLGRVLHAERVDGKGVELIARVDHQPETSPLRHLYEQVEKGSLNALSCGGFFQRAEVDGKPRIVDVDLTEWSITGVPVGKGTNFAVVGKKALAQEIEVPEVPEIEGQVRQSDLDQVGWIIEELKGVFDRLSSIPSQRESSD